MAAEFTIHVSDLRLVASQLKGGRGEHRDSETLDILVSKSQAAFRAVGTETEVPISAKQIGEVRLSFKSFRELKRVALSFKKKELHFAFRSGEAKVESFSRAHPDIEIITTSNRRLSLPIITNVPDRRDPPLKD